MPDTYNCFADLAKKEGPTAFRIVSEDAQSNVLIIAPHAGKIEPGTSEIARALSSSSFNLYLFEGTRKYNNQRLHITSTNFDERTALELTAQADFVLAVHGCQGDNTTTYLSGLDHTLITNISERLHSANFETDTHSSPHLQGTNKSNICNKGRRKMGAQLELSRALRDHLCEANQSMSRFAEAIRQAIVDSRA